MQGRANDIPTYQGIDDIAPFDGGWRRGMFPCNRGTREVTAHAGDTVRLHDHPRREASCGDSRGIGAMGQYSELL